MDGSPKHVAPGLAQHRDQQPGLVSQGRRAPWRRGQTPAAAAGLWRCVVTGGRRARGLTATVTSAGIVIFALVPASSGAAVRHQAQPPASARGPLSVQQALARAVRSRHAVAVPGATTATDTLTANPEGTLT